MSIKIFISIIILLLTHNINSKLTKFERIEFCNSLLCDETENKTVCGLKKKSGRNVYKLFDNECLLLKYGCQVDGDNAYGITNIERCNKRSQEYKDEHCPDCKVIEIIPVCGIRKDGEGFRVRLFESECHLYRYNCERKSQFNLTDLFICSNENNQLTILNRRKTSDLEIPNDIDDQDLDEITTIDQNINKTDEFGEVTTENRSYNGISRTGENIATKQTKTDAGEVDKTTNADQAIDNLGTHEEIKTVDETSFVFGETEITHPDANEISENMVTKQTVDRIHDLNEIKITATPINDSELVKNKIINQTIYDISKNRIRINDTVENSTTADQIPINNSSHKNIVVIHGSMADMLRINQTVENFFAATHVLDLPVQEVQPTTYENTRRRLVRIFGPVKVFTPWLKIPENITEDHQHKPTLSSCFHKCPTKCPDTYAPVCGVPGIVAREPSLMFQNHCFMDVAQCKMFWEDKSWTAESSSYIESSFLFCLGEELNGLYRFLPLIRTLQHMGRLKNKGRYHYKLTNMRFFNKLRSGQPNVMGR